MVSTAMVAVAAVVAGVVAGGIGWWWGRHRSEAPRPLTLVVGDSVTDLAAPEVGAALTGEDQPDDHVVLAARSGFTTADVLPLVREAVADAEGGLDRLAVLIGYNDVRLGSVATPALDELAGVAGRFRCTVVFTLPTVPWRGWGLADETVERRARFWNRRLARLAAATPGVHLSRAWQQEVEAPGGLELLDDDHLHPGPRGQARLAELYAQELAAAC
jgi:lysophospholipase L1-like esterase